MSLPLQTTPGGLAALQRARGNPGSFQDQIFHDAEESHILLADLQTWKRKCLKAETRIAGLESTVQVYEGVLATIADPATSSMTDHGTVLALRSHARLALNPLM